MVGVEGEELEWDADRFLGSEEHLWLRALRVCVEHSLLYRRLDVVNHLKVSPLTSVSHNPEYWELKLELCNLLECIFSEGIFFTS